MNEIAAEIGNRIRNFRKGKAITIQELSDKICKSKATVSKYEKGEIVIDIVTLYDIATALGVLCGTVTLLSSKPSCNSI